MAAKNVVVGDSDVDAVSIEGSAQDWVFSCGVCHVGGGQLEYDRDQVDYSASTNSGDNLQFFYPSPTNQDPTSAQPGIQVTATRYAETDCMICHASGSKNLNAAYATMDCSDTNRIGPMNDQNCNGDHDDVDFGMAADNASSMFAGQLTVTTPAIGEYDMYNRNHALKRQRLDLAASMGLGAVGVDATNQRAGADAFLADGTDTSALAGIDWGQAGVVLTDADISYKPNSKNCTVCHSRDDATLGLPGMIAMKGGFGNYIAADPAGEGFDSSDPNGDGSMTSDNWGFELGCKPGMGKRATSIGVGPHHMWGMSALAQNMQLGKNPGDQVTDETFFAGSPSEFSTKARRPDYDVHNVTDAMTGHSYGLTVEMSCSDCHYPMGKDDKFDATRASLSIGSTTAVDGTITTNAGKFRGVNYPATEIHAMDHQFATGNSSPDDNGMDYLDDTVTCDSCHITRTHPNLTDNGGTLVSPTPLHNGLPQLHIDRIACNTCHVPTIYAAPGKKKYRDWSAGFWKNSYYRNMLDWNYDLVTGSYKPTQPSHGWFTKNGETKISPFFPSFEPIWMDHVTLTNQEVGSEAIGSLTCGDSQITCTVDADCSAWTGVDANGNDVSLSGGDLTCNTTDAVSHHTGSYAFTKNRVMNRGGEYMENAFLAGTPGVKQLRRNEGYVTPFFDGFSLGDSLVIDTKADLDFMLDNAFPNVAEGGQVDHLAYIQKQFDVTHGVAPSEFALGAAEGGGCVMCHSSANPNDPNYSEDSVGFFEGKNQPQHYAGTQGFAADGSDPRAWMNGLGVGGVDHVKNWFATFADYDCTAMCNPGAQLNHFSGMMMDPTAPATMADADALYFDSTQNGAMISGAACTDSSMFSNNWQMGTAGFCTDADADPLTQGVCILGGAPSPVPCNAENNGALVQTPMGQMPLNSDCDSLGSIDMCVGMMQGGFDTMMGFPAGTAGSMGMNDGIAGLQAFLVKEGYMMGMVGCNPFMGPANLAPYNGMAGTVNNCMPDYSNATVAADPTVIATLTGMGGMTPAMMAGMLNGTCDLTGADFLANPPIPGSCAGGFRNTGACAADADCSGAMVDPAEVAFSPMGRILTRDQLREAYKVNVQQSYTAAVGGTCSGDAAVMGTCASSNNNGDACTDASDCAQLVDPQGIVDYSAITPECRDYTAAVSGVCSGDGSTGCTTDAECNDTHARLKWKIKAGKNPYNINHNNQWYQSEICIDPINSNLLNTVEVPCSDAAADPMGIGPMVQTVVHANQYLGYTDGVLAMLMTPGVAQGNSNAVVEAQFSGLTSEDVNQTVTFATQMLQQAGRCWDADAACAETDDYLTTELSACYTTEEGLEAGVDESSKKAQTCTSSWDTTGATTVGATPSGNGVIVQYPADNGTADDPATENVDESQLWTACLTMTMVDDATTADIDEGTVSDTQCVEIEAQTVEIPPVVAAATPVVETDNLDGTITLTCAAGAFDNVRQAYIYWGDRSRTVVKPSVADGTAADQFAAGITATVTGGNWRVVVMDDNHTEQSLTP